jgi:hypothetical protein
MQTRVNTLGDGKNWEDKDKLKVSIFTDYDPGSTAVLSFNGETWSRTGSFRWLTDDEQHTILAVYPSDTDFGKNNLQYDLQTDQSSESKLKNADLITGVLGICGVKRILFNAYLRYSGQKNVRVFCTREEALEWLSSE